MPSGIWLNWVNTRFQISRKRSQSQPGPQVGLPQPRSGPRSMWISDQDRTDAANFPPVISQAYNVSSGTPTTLCQISKASSSSVWMVMYSLSPGRPSSLVRNSQLQGITSFFEVIAKGEGCPAFQNRYGARSAANVFNITGTHAFLAGGDTSSRLVSF